jgi:hypothetical protein
MCPPVFQDRASSSYLEQMDITSANEMAEETLSVLISFRFVLVCETTAERSPYLLHPAALGWRRASRRPGHKFLRLARQYYLTGACNRSLACAKVKIRDG